jgi:hypothetical protein
MMRFTSSVGKLRLAAEAGCVPSARELLSRLEHENLVLTGELEQLRVLRSIVGRDPIPGLPDGVRFDRPDLDEARLVMAAMRSAMIRAGSRHAAALDVSIGCASWPADSPVASELVSSADRLTLADRLRLRRYSRRAPGKQRRTTTLALVK